MLDTETSNVFLKISIVDNLLYSTGKSTQCSVVTYMARKSKRSRYICVYIADLLYCTVAAAAAKSLQSCPTLCDPIDGSPPGFPVPGILQVRTLEWIAISFSNACN